MEKLRCGCQGKMRESEKVHEDRGQGSGEVDGTATQSQSVARGPAAVAGPANPGGQHLQSLKSFQRWTAAFMSRGRGEKVTVRYRKAEPQGGESWNLGNQRAGLLAAAMA